MWFGLYSYIFVAINSLMVLMLLNAQYGVNFKNKKIILYIIIITLINGTVIIFNGHSIYNVPIFIAVSIFLINQFINISWKPALFTMVQFFIAIGFGEAITYLIFIKYLGFTINDFHSSILLYTISHLVVYSIIGIIILFYTLIRKNNNHLDFYPNQNIITYYTVITLLAIIVNSLYIERSSYYPITVNIVLLLLFILSSLVFIAASQLLSIKINENIKLKSYLKEITELNNSLNTEINRRVKAEQELKTQALIDPLTNLLNRRAGILMLEKLMKQSQLDETNLIVCFIDINNLKQVNDKYGHLIGDELIVNTGNIIKECLRKSDIISRFGGDEFLAIFPDCNLENAKEIWDRVDGRLKQFNVDQSKPYQISLSCGLAEYDLKTDMPMDELIRIADKKMYNEKEKIKQIAYGIG